MPAPLTRDAPAQPPAKIFSSVRDEKIDDLLRDYIAILAQRYPFAIELKVESARIVDQLAEVWPEDAEWTAQAFDLWQIIDGIVQSLPAVHVEPKLQLHIAASAEPVMPRTPTSPDKHAALASFDGINGTLRHRVLPPQGENCASLEELHIPSGLVLLCQPVSLIVEKIEDQKEAEKLQVEKAATDPLEQAMKEENARSLQKEMQGVPIEKQLATAVPKPPEPQAAPDKTLAAKPETAPQAAPSPDQQEDIQPPHALPMRPPAPV